MFARAGFVSYPSRRDPALVLNPGRPASERDRGFHRLARRVSDFIAGMVRHSITCLSTAGLPAAARTWTRSPESNRDDLLCRQAHGRSATPRYYDASGRDRTHLCGFGGHIARSHVGYPPGFAPGSIEDTRFSSYRIVHGLSARAVGLSSHRCSPDFPLVLYIHELRVFVKLAPGVGFEPTTYGLTARRCCQLSYPGMKYATAIWGRC